MKPPDLRVVWARSAPVEEVRALPWMAQNFAASKPEEVEKEQEKVWLLQRTAPPPTLEVTGRFPTSRCT